MNIFLELFFVFVVFISFAGTGKFFLNLFKFNKPHIAISELTGAGLYSFVISILGHFYSLYWLTCIVIFLGLISFSYGFYKKWFFLPNLPIPIVNVYFLFALLMACYPSPYFDPLNYHLFGAIQWTKLDKLIHIKSAIQLMHNSYADYLYFPFTLFFGKNSLQHLISIQVSSQVFTVVLGIIIFSYLIYDLIKEKCHEIWIGLFILVALTRASLQHKGFIAKNDWIAISWFVASLYIFLKGNLKNTGVLILSSFFMGLSLGTKISYIIPAGFFYFFAPRLRKLKYKKFYLISFFSLLLFLSPFLLRNYFWTENPIFPLGHNFFSSNFLGPSWLSGRDFFDIGFYEINREFILNKLKRIYTYEPIVYLGIGLPIFFNHYFPLLKQLWIMTYIFLIFFILFFGSSSELRHFGPMALLMNLMGALFLMIVVEKIGFLSVHKKKIISLFISILVFNLLWQENQLNSIPSAVRQGVFVPRIQSLINEKRGLILSGHLDKFLKHGDKLGLIDDTPPYYFSRQNVVRLWDDPLLDRKIYKCMNIFCFIEILEQEKITFLVETGFLFDPYYNPNILNSILDLARHFPSIVVFHENGERLISVEKLKMKLQASRNMFK